MKRNISLDFIRIVAIWIIVTFHFCVLLTLNQGYANGDWGCVGTTIFFVLSGYVMRLCYKQITDIKKFYIKRFLSIYPMFWISFIIAYLIHSLQLSSFRYGGPLWKLLFSIIGIDNYLSFYQIPTYAVVGEWFTFIIIILYILYPILNTLFNKRFLVTTIILVALYFSNVFANAFTVPDDANLITGIFMFWIGMIIEKYNQELKKHLFHSIPFIIIAFIIIFIKLPFFPLPWKNLLGICFFIILLIITRKFDGRGFFAKNISFLSKVSYAIYLSHHFILYFMYARFGVYLISGRRILLFYVGALFIILLASIALYYITELFIKYIPQHIAKKSNNR